ncbi:hypothetical protein [Sphingobacterium pedocola]|uniref:Uncharacterized protein n=1 Tax=Sphingobacterium pedocola TaxID=2082722 RepID=A0ABR9T984_9SPHI|nr:hypothetical protein [Sphingobacterium pedocola]MBE8721908.1 hypothetical protein [Sphingobacterium pedocola]
MKNYIFNILLGLIIVALLPEVTIGQDASKTKEIRSQLSHLCGYSMKYDEFVQLPRAKYGEQIDKFEKLYRDQIKKIKHGPDRDLYFEFLEKATGPDSLKYKVGSGMPFPYVYFYTLLSKSRVDKMPTRIEYYKVVKYSLFTKDKEELIHPRDIPFLRYKEW